MSRVHPGLLGRHCGKPGCAERQGQLTAGRSPDENGEADSKVTYRDRHDGSGRVPPVSPKVQEGSPRACRRRTRRQAEKTRKPVAFETGVRMLVSRHDASPRLNSSLDRTGARSKWCALASYRNRPRAPAKLGPVAPHLGVRQTATNGIYRFLEGFSGLHLNRLEKTGMRPRPVNSFKRLTPDDGRQEPEREAFSPERTPLSATERVRRAHDAVLRLSLSDRRLAAHLALLCSTPILHTRPLASERTVLLCVVHDSRVSFSSLRPEAAKPTDDQSRPPFDHGAPRNQPRRQLPCLTVVLALLEALVCRDVRKQCVCRAHNGSEGHVGRVRHEGTLRSTRLDRSSTPLSRKSNRSRIRSYQPRLRRGRMGSRSGGQRIPPGAAFRLWLRCETLPTDASPGSSAGFALPLLLQLADLTALLPACAKLQLGPFARARAIPTREESTIQDNPPANDCSPWPLPPQVVHPTRLIAKGGPIRQMNGNETLARMLCSSKTGLAREGYLALCTEQVALRSRNGGIDPQCDLADVTVWLDATRRMGNRSCVEEFATPSRSQVRF